jgi:hypothetical protein
MGTPSSDPYKLRNLDPTRPPLFYGNVAALVVLDMRQV